MEIAQLDADGVLAVIEQLAELLKAAVEGGASLGYLAPMSIDAARRY